MGDLPAFAALGDLAAAGRRRSPWCAWPRSTRESPAAVAAAADLTVPGATGAVALLGALAAAAAA